MSEAGRRETSLTSINLLSSHPFGSPSLIISILLHFLPLLLLAQPLSAAPLTSHAVHPCVVKPL